MTEPAMTKPGVPIQRPMTGGEWALLICLSVLWGGSFFFVEIALTGVPVMSVVLARVTLDAARSARRGSALRSPMYSTFVSSRPRGRPISCS